MFISRKFVAFLAVALIGISFCQAAKEVKLIKGLEDEHDVEKSSWFGLGFVSPIQLADQETEIKVARLSIIYTYNKAVNGYDFGVVCYSGNANGLQTAWSNHTDGIMNGLTVGLFNIAEVEMNGMQLGVYNRAGSDSEDNIASKKLIPQDCNGAGQTALMLSLPVSSSVSPMFQRLSFKACSLGL